MSWFKRPNTVRVDGIEWKPDFSELDKFRQYIVNTPIESIEIPDFYIPDWPFRQRVSATVYKRRLYLLDPDSFKDGWLRLKRSWRTYFVTGTVQEDGKMIFEGGRGYVEFIYHSFTPRDQQHLVKDMLERKIGALLVFHQIKYDLGCRQSYLRFLNNYSHFRI